MPFDILYNLLYALQYTLHYMVYYILYTLYSILNIFYIPYCILYIYTICCMLNTVLYTLQKIPLVLIPSPNTNPRNSQKLNPPKIVPVQNRGEVLFFGDWGGLVLGGGDYTPEVPGELGASAGRCGLRLPKPARWTPSSGEPRVPITKGSVKRGRLKEI